MYALLATLPCAAAASDRAAVRARGGKPGDQGGGDQARMVLYVVAGCTAVGLLAAMYDVGYKEITWKEFSNRWAPLPRDSCDRRLLARGWNVRSDGRDKIQGRKRKRREGRES